MELVKFSVGRQAEIQVYGTHIIDVLATSQSEWKGVKLLKGWTL